VPKTSNKHQTPRKLTEKSYKNNVEVGNFRNKPQQLGSQRSQEISTCRGQKGNCQADGENGMGK